MRYIIGCILVGFVVLGFFFVTDMRGTDSVARVSPGSETTPAPKPSVVPEYIPASPSIGAIFSDDHQWVATLSGNPRIRTMVATGDIIPVRVTNQKVVAMNDFLYPYKKTADYVKDADITFGNLETPLMENCKVTNEGMRFCGRSNHVEGLLFAGIDIVNLANNHAGNYGESGLQETIDLLRNQKIAYTGLGETAVMDVKGKKFAFVGFSDISGTCCGLQTATFENIRTDIQKIRPLADIVVVQFHWGTEYEEDPDPRARELGKAAIDAGADIVIGNHPHWVQGVEYYKGKLVTYAHGNYIFDQMWSIETRQGVIGKYIFYDNQLIDVVYTPIVIDDFVQPRFANMAEKETILARMTRSSNKLLATPLQ